MRDRVSPALAAARSAQIRFLASGALWSGALLLALRSRPVEHALVAPFAAWQGRFAADVRGGLPVTVDLSCSGTDVIAICMAALLAYPVSWRRRLVGLVVAAVWIVSLNAIRIATLAKTSGTPLFLPLHLYIWPAVLIIAAAAFVLGWMWVVDGGPARTDPSAGRLTAVTLLLPLCVIAYAAATPSLLQSMRVQQVAMQSAAFAAAILNWLGTPALVGGSTLVVSRESLVVTPECVITPLMAVYVALALALPRGIGWRLIAIAIFFPIFMALSVLRLLTLAIPPVIMGSPLFLTHGFYQVLVGLLLLAIVPYWRSGGDCRTAGRRFAAAAAASLVVAVVLARPYTGIIDAGARAVQVLAPHAALPAVSDGDVQGAKAILPGYELALLVGLWVGWFGRRAWGSLTILVGIAALAQVATLAVLGEVAAHLELQTPTVFVRAAAILTPVALVAIVALRRGGATPPAPQVMAGHA